MRRRAVTGTIVASGGAVQSPQLLHIKPQPEGRLCTQLVELEKQYLHLLQVQQHCAGQSSILSTLMEKMLCWSGCLSANELRVQKRRLGILLRQQQQFTRQQQTLMHQLAQLRAHQQVLLRQLYHFLLGKENADEFMMANISSLDS